MRAQTTRPARFSPLDPQGQTVAWRLGAVILGSLFLALSSRIEVPMVPVPITMQTFAVTLIGALYGWRMAGVTIAAWLAQAAIGLPVLAGGNGGLHAFAGPTAGYLFAFPFAAMIVGWLAQQGWNGRKIWLAGAAMLIGNVLCLILGAAWLGMLIGAEQAVTFGVMPFLVGAVVKSVLGAMTLRLMTPGTRQAE